MTQLVEAMKKQQGIAKWITNIMEYLQVQLVFWTCKIFASNYPHFTGTRFITCKYVCIGTSTKGSNKLLLQFILHVLSAFKTFNSIIYHFLSNCIFLASVFNMIKTKNIFYEQFPKQCMQISYVNQDKQVFGHN